MGSVLAMNKDERRKERFNDVVSNIKQLKGKDSLNAIILMAAPEDLDERLKSEVENVKPLEKHLSCVIIGDEWVTLLDKLLKKYKIKFVATKRKRKESVFGSYTDTYRIYFLQQKVCGFLLIIIGILCPIFFDGDATVSIIVIPIGVYLLFTKWRVMNFRM